MPRKGKGKKVKVVEDKLTVNDVVTDEVIKTKKIGDVGNGMNRSGETEVSSGSDASNNDKVGSKRRLKPEDEKEEESSDVKEDKPKDLTANQGRKAAKIVNGNKKEGDEAKAVVEDKEESAEDEKNKESSDVKEDEPKDLPAKRGRKAAKDANGSKKQGDETKSVIEVKDLLRSRRNVKADVESSNEVKEQNQPEPKETKAKAGKKANVQVKENSVEKEAPTKRAGQKKKNVAEKVEVEKLPAIDENRQPRVALKRYQNLDEMARQQRENDAEDFVEPKVKGSAKVKGKGAMKDTAEESQPAKKTKEDAKLKGAPKKEKEKIPDVTVLDFSNESKTKEGKPWNLKIVTWNVNGLRAWLEKNGISYLHHEKPDIVCIQGTKCSDDKLPNELVKIDGYHCHWLAGDKEGYSGVGLLTKEKPKSVQYGIDIEEHDNEGRVITAEYAKFFLVTAYIPNAGRGLVRLDYRQKWDKDFRDYIKKLNEKKPVVLCGDLNVAHEEIDLANPKGNKKKAGFSKEEREAFSTLLSEGFVDTFRNLYPEGKGAYTFWTYMTSRAKNVGWRLDYFVVSEKFMDHLCDTVIRKNVYGSNHCPVALFLHV